MFWNSENKMNRIGTFIKYHFLYLNLTSYLNFTWAWVKCESGYHIRILCPNWLAERVSHGTRAIFSYVDRFWPELDLNLDLCLARASYLGVCYHRHSFRSTMTGSGFAAVSGLVSAADKTKRAIFDSWPDLDPAFDVCKNISRALVDPGGRDI